MTSNFVSYFKKLVLGALSQCRFENSNPMLYRDVHIVTVYATEP